MNLTQGFSILEVERGFASIREPPTHYLLSLLLGFYSAARAFACRAFIAFFGLLSAVPICV